MTEIISGLNSFKFTIWKLPILSPVTIKVTQNHKMVLSACLCYKYLKLVTYIRRGIRNCSTNSQKFTLYTVYTIGQESILSHTLKSEADKLLTRLFLKKWNTLQYTWLLCITSIIGQRLNNKHSMNYYV